MISLLLGLALAASQATANEVAIDNSRKALVACLKQAASSAKPGEIALDGFAEFAKARCGTEETALLEAMVRFDMKNGVSRTTGRRRCRFVSSVRRRSLGAAQSSRRARA